MCVPAKLAIEFVTWDIFHWRSENKAAAKIGEELDAESMAAFVDSVAAEPKPGC